MKIEYIFTNERIVLYNTFNEVSKKKCHIQALNECLLLNSDDEEPDEIWTFKENTNSN